MVLRNSDDYSTRAGRYSLKAFDAQFFIPLFSYNLTMHSGSTILPVILRRCCYPPQADVRLQVMFASTRADGVMPSNWRELPWADLCPQNTNSGGLFVAAGTGRVDE